MSETTITSTRWRDQPVSALPINGGSMLRTRVLRRLGMLGCVTIGDVASLDKRAIDQCKGLGRKSRSSINAAIARARSGEQSGLPTVRLRTAAPIQPRAMAMPEAPTVERVRVGARMTITLDIDHVGEWAINCPVSLLREKAAEAGIDKVRAALGKGFTIIGDPKVAAIFAGDDND